METVKQALNINNLTRKNIIFGITILMLFLSSPLFMDYLPASGELGSYFMETEGIRGPFLAALLFLTKLGVSIQGSCKLYLFGMNLITCAASYLAFRRIVKNEYAALAGSISYSFSIYSIYIRHIAGSLGEVAAFAFVPVILYGYYGLYTETEKKKNVINGGLLAVGLAMLFYASVPIGMIGMGFVVLGGIISAKQTFKKPVLYLLPMALILAVLLALPILIPYVRDMFRGVRYIYDGNDFRGRGLLPVQLFLSFFGVSGSGEGQTANVEFIGIGLPGLCALAVWLGCCLAGEAGRLKENKKGARKAALVAVAAMLMSLQFFPWDRLQAIHWLPNVIMEHVGYPRRFLVVAVLLLSLLVSMIGKAVWDYKKEFMSLFLIVVVGLNIMSGVYLMNDILYTTEKNHISQESQEWQNGEYLLYISR